MARLTRAETQERNRAKVLAAAKDEFTERGFREAKIDSIAERAELTRGAVYSNFPGKRALYFAVLAEYAPRPPALEPGLTVAEALGVFARAWVGRLPLVTDGRHASARLAMDLLPEIIADERIWVPFTQLTKLNALLLGLSLERLSPRSGRLVRVAESALTVLHGASQLAAAAPGFTEPFNVVSTCARLADVDLGDEWLPSRMIPQTRSLDVPWDPPGAVDALREEPVSLAGDGIVALLGLHRVSAIEEAVRAAAPDTEITAVLVTGDPGELMPLARLVIADLRACLRQAFPHSAWPRLRVICDETGAVAAAAGVPAISDATETAVRVATGRIVERADGYGACHYAGTASQRVFD
ncbi:DNA-binding transcriptional regulator, AcrR family [Amycolatopsis xylanica]|uniref:DNA-binding transcriptional regulator, AcrR family n=1 Tax=Amycolatopsis xylanica TaxID=589385 RepID=A0A1H3DVZ2_9PSEU|nr:helix-turn-helix domain-containing protein [Amycolatopsis xylanica]SDX70517.1 DNA-binding transcriptional regulator, AcrR family [Amycolatopsis xylanica]